MRVEAIGPNRDNLFRLQNTIYSHVSSNQVTVSIFATSSANGLQVTLNKKGRTFPIYSGQDETDYESIAATVAGYVWDKSIWSLNETIVWKSGTMAKQKWSHSFSITIHTL